MKHKNDLIIDDNTPKQASFGERMHHDGNDDESKRTIEEETIRSVSMSSSSTFKKEAQAMNRCNRYQGIFQ